MILLKLAKLTDFRVWITLIIAWRWLVEIFGNSFRLILFRFWIIAFFTIIASYKLTHNLNSSTFFCEFKSIWLEVNEDLLDSFFIWLNYMILFGLRDIFTVIWILFVFIDHSLFLKTNKISRYNNILWFGLILLNRNNLINRSFNIKLLNNFDEFSSF